MNTVPVKHVSVIPLFHFFQHDVNAARDRQPAESTPKFEVWVIIIQPQIFKDKYLQCDFALKGFSWGRSLRACGQSVYLLRYSELYSEVIVNSSTGMTGRDGTKDRKRAYVEDERNYL